MIRSGVFASLLFLCSSAFGGYETADDSLYSRLILPRSELRWVIDMPTAGMLPRGAFDLDVRTFPTGGMQASLGIGLLSRFSVGIAYGASRALSDESPDWNPQLEFQLKYRLLEESEELPAVAVGYSSQGYGKYDVDHNRYMIKSLGFYLALSKNFNFYSNPAGWHGGINYSLENEIDADPSVFVGFNSDIGQNMSFLTEYDFAFNDTRRYHIYGLKRGYFNMGLAWYITSELSLELDFKNLFRNLSGAQAIDREVRLVYVEYFY